VPDFTAARYLDLRHPSASLGRWSCLSRGVPAVLSSDADEQLLSARLSELMGTGGALVMPSTLHAAFDLFGVLGGTPNAVYVDEAAYPVLRWGTERAAVRGAPLVGWPHHDVAALRRRLAERDRRRRPIVVADALCGGCGELAPIAALAELVRAHDGLLVLDDSQGLGLVGDRFGEKERPYGRGGGGSLRYAAVCDAAIVVVASLAKGFGAPIAVIAGDRALVAKLERASQVRLHCSPPSTVAVRAAAQALYVNERRGDELRQKLARNLARLRQLLRGAGLEPLGGAFPVQDVSTDAENAMALHRRLLQLGVRTVVRRPRCRGAVAVSFVVNAGHSDGELEQVGRAVRQAAGAISRMRGCA
jgi:8-amino-7-oxononanoate synthase